MGRNRLWRAAAAALVAAIGLAAALMAGAPIAAALLGLMAGTVAMAIVWAPSSAQPAAEAREEAPAASPVPSAEDVVRAVDEPMLIVRSRKILVANTAARAVLGDHIEGVDVRLAIRHPAAAERLADRAGTADTSDKTELVGLGERDRRWEMTTAPLGDGSRLVRLTDRSTVHASEQMRVDFVANASHELRTPLATILGFLETLQDEEAAADPKTRSRFVTIMFGEARRMRQLVDDLISLSRIEGERFSPPRESVDLVPLLEEVRANVGQLLEQKQALLTVESDGGDAIVAGDQPQLLQLLSNLVVNALKYGGAGTPVTIGLEASGPDMLRISVTDRGEGIPPEHLPRLTERFYRVDPSRSRAIGGTGLGLAIVKHIVGRHRGRFEIRSTVGEGTIVDVWLPRAQPLSSRSHADVTEDSPGKASGSWSSG